MRSAPDTQPPEETPAKMPSQRASARIVSSACARGQGATCHVSGDACLFHRVQANTLISHLRASACPMSSVRSTRASSKMDGRYSYAKERAETRE
jgi:hypothetical protein